MTWLDALFIVIATLIGVGFGYHLRTLKLRRTTPEAAALDQEHKQHPARASIPDSESSHPQRAGADDDDPRIRAARIRQSGEITSYLPPGGLPPSPDHPAMGQAVKLHPSGGGAPQTITVSSTETVVSSSTFMGLASDLALRMVGDTLMVRAKTEGAQLIIRSTRMPISRVEIPWRNGHIANGAFTLESELPDLPSRLQVRLPRQVATAIAALDDWVVAADDPDTAVVATQLFVPRNLDPVGSWQERFAAYQESIGHAISDKVSLIWMPEGQIEVGGNLISKVGLAADGDDFAGLVKDTPFSEHFSGPTRLNQVWLQIGERWGSDDCIIVQRLR